ncbi:hypothetical protein M3J09_005873 [Ascochyta lentis]
MPPIAHRRSTPARCEKGQANRSPSRLRCGASLNTTRPYYVQLSGQSDSSQARIFPFGKFDGFHDHPFLRFSQPLRLHMTTHLNKHLQHRFSTLYPRRSGPAVLFNLGF